MCLCDNNSTHTVSFEVFRSLSEHEFATFYLTYFWFFFVKSQHSFPDFRYLTRFFQHYKYIYGANLRGSVFRVISGVLDGEFDSIENSSGFARLLWENWGFQMMPEKNVLNDKSVRVNIVISREKVELCLRSKMLQIHTQKVNEKSQNWQWYITSKIKWE